MYEVLNDDAKHQLRIERIAALEADHFRLRLQLDETINADEMQRIRLNMSDLERRMVVHRSVLSPSSTRETEFVEVSTNASNLATQNSGDGG